MYLYTEVYNMYIRALWYILVSMKYYNVVQILYLQLVSMKYFNVVHAIAVLTPGEHELL